MVSVDQEFEKHSAGSFWLISRGDGVGQWENGGWQALLPSRRLHGISLSLFETTIEIKFTYHPSHPFKVYSSVVFSVFTEFYNY